MAARIIITDPVLVTRAAARDRGERRYFTGVPCVAGHVAIRYTANGTCCECVHAKKRWLQGDRAARNEANRRYLATEAGREKNRLASERIRHRHPKRVRDWKRANPEAVRVISGNRRARKLEAGGTYTRDQIAAMLTAQKRKCIGCNKSLRNGYHVDHIYPLSRGGSNDISNIQLLCPRCNLTKNAKDPFDWARLRGLLL